MTSKTTSHMRAAYLRNSRRFSTKITSQSISSPCPKDHTPHAKRSNIIYPVRCSEECSILYIGETKRPLYKHMAQHSRPIASGPGSAVHLHLKDKGPFFEDNNVHILGREDRWFERGVKKVTHVKIERNHLWNRRGGL